MGTLRHRKGAPGDTYDVSGSLDGVRPGNRMVRWLSVKGLTRESREGLRPLTAFEHLETLELVGLSGVDLAPLAEVTTKRLTMTSLEGVDLAPLARLGPLRILSIGNLRDCRVPEHLPLPTTLESLGLANDLPPDGGAPVKALIDAIDWGGLPELRSLDIRVGGLRSSDTITVSTRFLEPLRCLDYLRLDPGVWLDPPFEGLPPTLTSITVDAWDPDTTRDMLRRQLPGAHVLVQQRFGPAPAVERWAIAPPEPGDDPPEWSAYGSLADAAGDPSVETENQALRLARRRLRDTDRALAARVEWDQEADGTSIIASSREDLERALEILGLP